jgi:hypothetical protein
LNDTGCTGRGVTVLKWDETPVSAGVVFVGSRRGRGSGLYKAAAVVFILICVTAVAICGVRVWIGPPGDVLDETAFLSLTGRNNSSWRRVREFVYGIRCGNPTADNVGSLRVGVRDRRVTSREVVMMRIPLS